MARKPRYRIEVRCGKNEEWQEARLVSNIVDADRGTSVIIAEGGYTHGRFIVIDSGEIGFQYISSAYAKKNPQEAHEEADFIIDENNGRTKA